MRTCCGKNFKSAQAFMGHVNRVHHGLAPSEVPKALPEAPLAGEEGLAEPAVVNDLQDLVRRLVEKETYLHDRIAELDRCRGELLATFQLRQKLEELVDAYRRTRGENVTVSGVIATAVIATGAA